uniref:IS6 family transposase n=1 Tax=Caballeronia mineralivorans TaxID=2010198 RepID=UPI00389940A6
MYDRFPLGLRMVEELLAAPGIELTYETVRRWSVKFGLGIARRIRSTALGRGDKWRLDEVVVTINGRKHWLWRALDQHGAVLDVLAQSRRDRHAARRLMRKVLKKHGRAPRVLITDKLKSYAAANRDLGITETNCAYLAARITKSSLHAARRQIRQRQKTRNQLLEQYQSHSL